MLEDAVLLNLVRNGNELAFNDLYNKYYPLLKKGAHYLLRSNVEVEDIVQDIFIDLWVRRQIIPPTTSIKFYLFKAIHYKCIDRQRKHMTFQNYLQYCQVCLPTIVYNRKTDNKDLAATIEKAFHGLPPGQEEVCRLRYKKEYETKEIAVLLGTRIPTVKNQCVQGSKKLRKALINTYLP